MKAMVISPCVEVGMVGMLGLVGTRAYDEDGIEFLFLLRCDKNVAISDDAFRALMQKEFNIPETGRNAQGNLIVRFSYHIETDRLKLNNKSVCADVARRVKELIGGYF